MKLLDFLKFNFNRPKKTAAQVAKERLQIIVSHESARQTSPDMMKKLQKELLEVICKYVHIDQDKIKVQLERHGDQSVLELNVTLQEDTLEKSIASV
ncbi:MAG: cell division topological specificity factor MinE [Candidatus Berkiella sp.]